MNNFQLIFFYVCGKFRKQFFMSLPESETDYEKSRRCYIVGDASAQIIGQLAGGSFLMTLLTVLGMRDGTIGTVISIGTLASLFQLITMNKVRRLKKHKLFVCVCNFMKICFGILFFIPLTNISYKAALCVFLYLFTQMTTQLANPAATEWITSLVPEARRGSFFSLKEAVAVASTVIMMFVMGVVLDFAKQRDILLGLQLVGVVIILFAIANTISFICMNEAKISYLNEEGKELHGILAKKNQQKKPSIDNVNVCYEWKRAFHHSGFLRVLILYILWNISFYITSPFNTSYAVKELRLSYTYIMLVGLITTIVRVILTPKMGKKADSTSHEMMLIISLSSMAVSHFIFAFTTPENVKVFYPVLSVFSAIGWCYISIGMLNLQLKYLDNTNRLIQISILTCISGVMGFLVASITGNLVNWLQLQEIVVFQQKIYAQQITNLSGCIGFVMLIFYIKRAFQK